MDDQTRPNTCPSCGSDQRPEARFCDQCGRQLSSAGLATQRLSGAPLAHAQGSAAPSGALFHTLLRLLARRETPDDARHPPGGGPPSTSRDAPEAAPAEVRGTPATPTPHPLVPRNNPERARALAEDAQWARPPEGAVPPGEWGMIGAYALAVHRTLRGFDDMQNPCVVIEVEYRSRSRKPLRCSIYQWALVDSLGYRYTVETYNGSYLGERGRRLQAEDFLPPDGTVRGWVAFHCPPDAPVSHARFREHRLMASELLLALPPAEYRDFSRR